jgi:hypothetical protein
MEVNGTSGIDMYLIDICWKNFHLIEVPEGRFYATYFSTVLYVRVHCKIQNLFGCAIIFHCLYMPPRYASEIQEPFFYVQHSITGTANLRDKYNQ